MIFKFPLTEMRGLVIVSQLIKCVVSHIKERRIIVAAERLKYSLSHTDISNGTCNQSADNFVVGPIDI